MTRKYEDSIKSFWHWGTGLVKRSVFYTRLNSEGLIFQTQGCGNGKRLLFIPPPWSNHVLNKAREPDLWPNSAIFCDSLSLCLTEKTDRKLVRVCLRLLQYMKWCVLYYGAWEDYVYFVYVGGLDGLAQLTEIWSSRSPPSIGPYKHTHKYTNVVINYGEMYLL